MQSYRDLLKGHGYKTAEVSAAAISEIHWPSDISHDDIDSLNRTVEAVNDGVSRAMKAMDSWLASGYVPNVDIPYRERRPPASELNDYLKTLYSRGYRVSFSQADAFDDLHIEMTTKDAALKASLWDDRRYDPSAILRRIETMKSTLDLLDEEDEQ